MNNLVYTSASKNWWHKNSDRLGGDMNWDTFSEVWMAALNNEESAPSASKSVARNWWLKNSDRLGGEMNWDTFNEVWMAALNSEAPSASKSEEIMRLKEENRRLKEMCKKIS